MTDTTFDFDGMLCFALYSTTNAMIRDYSEPLKRCEVTYPQLLVMAALWERDNVSISDLSEKTLFDLGTLTPIIRRLAKAGFIEVYLDPSDKRRKNVLLTRKGRDLRRKAANVFMNMSCKLDLADEEVKQVLNVCKKIKARLQA